MDATLPVDDIIAQLSPEALLSAVRVLMANRPAEARDHVELTEVMAHLLGDVALPPGAKGWQAQLRLRQAIIAVAAQTPGLRYVPGDS